MNRIGKFCILVLCVFFVGCASEADVNIEEARFALDSGDWNGAISHAKAVFDSDPSNIPAALIMSSAYAGRGGFRLLELVNVVASDLRTHDIFDAMQDALLVVEAVDPTDLRLALDTLLDRVNPEPELGHVKFIDYNFQAGLLMIIEAYSKASLVAQDEESDPVNADAITEETKEIVISDMVGFDDRLVAAGVSEDDLMIKNARITYCVLKNASTGATGVDLSVLRDLSKCQLSENDGADLTQADFESQGITSCADFNFDACETAGDTEL